MAHVRGGAGGEAGDGEVNGRDAREIFEGKREKLGLPRKASAVCRLHVASHGWSCPAGRVRAPATLLWSALNRETLRCARLGGNLGGLGLDALIPFVIFVYGVVDASMTLPRTC